MIRVSRVVAIMSSTDTPSGPGATGIVEISELTAAELQSFASERADEGEIAIQRRGADAFLLTE